MWRSFMRDVEDFGLVGTTVLLLCLGLMIVLVGWGIYTEIAHPCLRYGEPYQQTTQTLVYADGKGTQVWMPQTYTTRDCLERAP